MLNAQVAFIEQLRNSADSRDSKESIESIDSSDNTHSTDLSVDLLSTKDYIN